MAMVESLSFIDSSKWKKILLVAASSVLLMSCTSSENEELPEQTGATAALNSTPTVVSADNTALNNTISTTPATPVTPVTETVPSGVDSNGCPVSPSRRYHSFRVSGSVVNTTVTNGETGFEISADQKLRISVQPLQAEITTSSTVNIRHHTQMAFVVELLQEGNSTPIASKSVSAFDSRGYKLGLAVNAISHPSYIDFSSALRGSGRYKVRIRDVNTDYRCRAFCTVERSMCAYDLYALATKYYSATYRQLTYGQYETVFDYITGRDAVCVTGSVGYTTSSITNASLRECQLRHCGVGSIGTVPSYTWSVNVYVETDQTSCIGT